MPVWFAGTGHIFARQAAAHNGVIVMFDASTAKFDVVEAGRIAGYPYRISRLQLGIDQIATEFWVYLKAWLCGQLNVGLEANSHYHMIGQ